MHFQGQQLVSRETHVSSRSLVALGLAKIFAVKLGLSMQNLTILNVTPGAEAVSLGTDLLLVFLGLNHLLSWCGDLAAFKGWNSEQKVSGVSTFGHGGSPLQSKLDAAIGNVKNFQENAEAKLKSAEPEQLTELQNKASQLIELFQTMNRGASRLSWYAATYLWGWFFLMPYAILVYALYL